MSDAVRIGDDDGRSVVGFGFKEGLDGLHPVESHGNAGHVYITVTHGHHSQVLLADGLAAGGELRDGSDGRGLGHLPPGVGVHFGVHDEDVDVLARGKHVVETAETDVVGPSVTAEDPDGAADKIVGDGEKLQSRF